MRQQRKIPKKRCARCNTKQHDVHNVVQREVRIRFPRLCGACLVLGFSEALSDEESKK